MKYFNSLPLVSVTTPDNKTTLYRNLMTRISIIPSILNNPLVYYSYDIQEGDTPEIVADKYYGDSYRYWIVMFSNQMMDPQWDWPLNSENFQKYIIDKYTNMGIDPYTTVKSYQKTITQTDSLGQVSSDTVEISKSDFDNNVDSSYNLTISGETVNVSITFNTLNYYQYEVNLNESKRTIKLLNKDYVTQIENEFKSLLG